MKKKTGENDGEKWLLPGFCGVLGEFGCLEIRIDRRGDARWWGWIGGATRQGGMEDAVGCLPEYGGF